ncbi:MAG: hypothetical protein HRT89_19300 [Lentisphaeria bacterium]|nr:hypothetical protein [Lentisphaeria bacterium]NQZ70205.1 hypothetical protein [Lentisphaeria bacterium]
MMRNSILLLFFSSQLFLNAADSILFNSPIDGIVAVVIDAKDGTRLRNVVAHWPVKKGQNRVIWDYKNEAGKPVPNGTYKWRAIIAPYMMGITYQQTPYPNVEQHSPNTSPWEGGNRHGWMGNHTISRSVAAVNCKTYITQNGTEGGHSMAVLNSKGEKIYGRGKGCDNMFKDWQGTLYIQNGGSIGIFDQEKYTVTHTLGVGGNVNAIAAWKGKMYVMYGSNPNSPPIRMVIYDIKSKKRLKEMAVKGIKGHYSYNFTDRMNFSPKGDLFIVSGTQVLKVNTSTMKTSVVVKKGLKDARFVCFDKKGMMYVWDQIARQVKVFSGNGKLKRTICKGGIQQAGPYDPNIVGEASSIAVDNGFVWLNYPYESPRKVAKFTSDGKHVMDYYGNTYYGGGGSLDTTESSQNTYIYYRESAFKLNMKKGTSKLTHVLDGNQGHSSLYSGNYNIRNDWVTTRVKGKKYFSSAPLLFRYFQAIGAVWIYNEKKKKVRFCAAMGMVSRLPHFNNSAAKAYIASKKLNFSKTFFNWSDLNGDGKVDMKECKFKERPSNDRYSYLGRFDHKLGVQGRNLRFEVSKFLSDGTPIYKEKKMPHSAIYKFPSGISVNFNAPHSAKYRQHGNEGYKNGKRIWFYPASYDVNGMNVGAFQPGLITNQFGVSGEGNAHVGDLGEFFVTHANNGRLSIWSTDGFLAGQITLHLKDRRSRRWSSKSFKKGAKYDGLTIGQEHFHNFFGQTTDNRYFFIAGGDITGLFEVTGWEKFKRIKGTVTVTGGPPPVAAAATSKPVKKDSKGGNVSTSTTLMTAALVKTPRLDGKGSKYSTPYYSIPGKGKFKMGYTANNLVFLWEIHGGGPIRNIGEEFVRYFKTGSSVDVKLSTNPNANHSSNKPVAGDIRILVTKVKGKRVAVLYRPIASSGKPWSVSTPAGGTASFQDVRILKKALIRIKQLKNSYSVEVAVPYTALGMKPVKKGLKLKFDWGVYSTAEGNLPTMRNYWANKKAVGVKDEPTEARFQPKFWGTVHFQ